jgi:hypothetical protein
MRAARADRERAIEVLKDAFVQDRLTKDELGSRVGQALAARTYADLAAATAGIPELPPLPRTAHRAARNEVSRAVKSSGGALGVVIAATGTVAGVADGPVAGVFVAVLFVILLAVTAGFAALVIRGALVIEERSPRRKRPGGRTPPGPGLGTSDPARRRPSPAPPRRRGADPAIASALWTARRRPRRSTTVWTSSPACRSPATRRLAPR